MDKHVVKVNKLLDAGAGRLAYKDLLTNYCAKYVSSDFQKTHKNLDIVANIEKLPFNNEFDLVFCSEVLEHVPHPSVAIKSIKKSLKKRGGIIITVPHLAYLHNEPHDFFRYTKHGISKLLIEEGFKIILLKELGGIFCFLGYIRSTILLPFISIPVLGKIIFTINYILSQIDIILDELSKNYKIIPLNYIVYAQK